jgi:segregation and condensation protein B
MTTEDVVEANQEEQTTSHEEVSEKLADQPESPESSGDTQASDEVVAASEAGEASEQREAQPSTSGEEAQQGPQLTAEQKVGLLEALLLASGDPLPISRVEELLGCQKADVLALAETLKQSYAAESRGLELVNVSSKLQLRTKALYAEYVRNLIAVKPRKLSQAALETLAVIAYQQPVVKSEVDKIRGVDVAPTIKTLLERKLVKILGYQPSVGQPALYGTTEDFLSIFGLTSLAELPSLRDLKALVKEPGEALEVAESDENSEDAEDGDSSEDVQESGEEAVSTEPLPETRTTENATVIQ